MAASAALVVVDGTGVEREAPVRDEDVWSGEGEGYSVESL